MMNEEKIKVDDLIVDASLITSTIEGTIGFVYSEINVSEPSMESINILIGFLTSLSALTEKHRSELTKFDKENR